MGFQHREVAQIRRRGLVLLELRIVRIVPPTPSGRSSRSASPWRWASLTFRGLAQPRQKEVIRQEVLHASRLQWVEDAVLGDPIPEKEVVVLVK